MLVQVNSVQLSSENSSQKTNWLNNTLEKEQAAQQVVVILE